MPTFYLLGLGWANGWVLFESAHHLPAGYKLGKLFQNPQLTHNVPTGYIALCPQCEGVIQSMSDKLCRCGDRELSVEVRIEELRIEEAEGSQLEYAKDDEYHIPEVEEALLLVCELRLIKSPSLDQLVNFFNGDECC